MDQPITRPSRVRRDAAIAFLEAYMEGRPVQELRNDLPNELEATGQVEAAQIVRSFFGAAHAGRGLARVQTANPKPE
jgi:hypothetical protein